jgi:hypothetical protein
MLNPYQGGSIGLLALNALFTLIKDYNLQVNAGIPIYQI